VARPARHKTPRGIGTFHVDSIKINQPQCDAIFFIYEEAAVFPASDLFPPGHVLIHVDDMTRIHVPANIGMVSPDPYSRKIIRFHLPETPYRGNHVIGIFWI
jgi:hypothetical protein